MRCDILACLLFVGLEGSSEDGLREEELRRGKWLVDWNIV